VKRGLKFLFGVSLRLLPGGFRRCYGREMEDVFAARIEEMPLPRAFLAVVMEMIGVVTAAASLRPAVAASLRPRTLGTIAAGCALAAILLQAAPSIPLPPTGQVRDSIHFTAHDPAGEFSITMKGGRTIAATIDNVPVARERVVQAGDSIRFLAPGGEIVLALSYHAGTGRIEWEARQSSCRGKAATCVMLQ